MRNASVYLYARLTHLPSHNEERWVVRAMRGRAFLRWFDSDGPWLEVVVAKHAAKEVRVWLVEILRSLRLATDLEPFPPPEVRSFAR